MLALKARCMEEGDSMKGGDEVAGLKEGRLPVRTVFALGVLPSKALNACTAQPFVKQPDSNHETYSVLLADAMSHINGALYDSETAMHQA